LVKAIIPIVDNRRQKLVEFGYEWPDKPVRPPVDME